MTDIFIFVYGVVVSVVVSAGGAMLLWAAVEDGRMQELAEERSENATKPESANSN